MRVLAVVHQRDAGPGVFGETVRALGHELVEWMPRGGPAPDVDRADAVLVFGGAMDVDEEEANPWLVHEKQLLRRLLAERKPLLGVCLGAQLVAEAAGSVPRRASRPEIGWFDIALEPAAREDLLFGALPDRIEGFHWHSFEAPLPPRAVPLARSPVCLQAYRLGDAPGWGIQFHAEVTRGIVADWLADYRNDPDAVRIGVDPEALGAETARKIDRWNELGRGLCARFLEAALPDSTRA